MGAAYVDRVWETSTTTGTGAIALGGAKTGYSAFSASVDDAETCYFVIEAVDGNGVPTGQWEIQNNAYNSGSNTLSRSAPNVVNGSSGPSTLVNFSAGTKNVFLAITAETFITRDGTFAFTGIVDMGGFRLFNLGSPVSGADGATKNYVDTAVAALAPKDDCQAATVVALAASTYNNGSSGVGATLTANAAAVLIIDGYTVALDNRLLIKNQSDAKQNGLYSVTTLGTGAVAWVLTRTTDFNQPGDGLNGALVYILNGTVNANTLWSNTNGANITFGSSNINWIQFQGATYTADETTLHLSGTTFSIKSTYPGQSSIVTLGTVTAGVWNGTAIAATYIGAHASSHQNGGSDEIAVAAAAANAIPKAGAGGTLAIGWIPTGSSSSTVCIGNDARLCPTGSIMEYGGTAAPTGWLFCDGSSVSRTTFSALYAVLVTSKGTVTVTLASPGVFTLNGHGLSNGDKVFLETSGSLPTGLSADTTYFVVSAATNTFQLSATSGGTAINTSVSQSGTHTLFYAPFGIPAGSSTNFLVPDLRGAVAVGVGTGSGLTARNLGNSGGEESHTLSIAEMPAHTHSGTAFATNSPGAGGNALQGASASNTTAAVATQGGGGSHNNMQPWLAVNRIIKT